MEFIPKLWAERADQKHANNRSIGSWRSLLYNNNNNNNNNKFFQYYHFVQVLPLKITIKNS